MSEARASGETTPGRPDRLRQTIDFRDVSITRDGRVALDRVSVELREDRIGIIGLNGSGKSTLLRAIIGLVKPTSGSILVDGRDVAADVGAVRASTALLFQNPDNQIVFPIVGEDLAFGLEGRGFSKTERAERVAAALERLDIGRLIDRRIHELSGGEKQLVALAGLLAIEPKTVLFDEPTSQLDLKNRNRLRDALAALPEQAIVVAHDLELLADFERVIVMDQGRIVYDGRAEEAIAVHREIAR